MRKENKLIWERYSEASNPAIDSKIYIDKTPEDMGVKFSDISQEEESEIKQSQNEAISKIFLNYAENKFYKIVVKSVRTRDGSIEGPVYAVPVNYNPHDRPGTGQLGWIISGYDFKTNDIVHFITKLMDK